MDYDSTTPSPAMMSRRYQALFWNLPPAQPRRKPLWVRLFKLPRLVRLNLKPRFV